MRFPACRAIGARMAAMSAWAVFAFAFLLLTAGYPVAAIAQQTPAITADQLVQLQQMREKSANGGQGGVQNQTTVLEPNAPANPRLPASRLEKILSGRAGIILSQFGYDQLGIGRAVTLPQAGSVQDDYILGPGDEIAVTLRGQENSEIRAAVDRSGRVTLPRLSPVSAAGRNLGDVRRDLVAAIHRAYVSTEGYVALGQVRQIGVLVSGEVNSPGMRTLTGLSTAVDAILVSGGVKKTGSLRRIVIQRGGHEIVVDLYSVLSGQGGAAPVTLADGDRVVVPPLGHVVAVTGWVRRPGIYEISGGAATVRVDALMSLAGGLEVRGRYRLAVMKVAADGRSQMIEIDRGFVGDSEILFVKPAADETVDRATLAGGASLAGQYAARGTKLSEILKSPGALGEDPYTLFGVISRRDPVTRLRMLLPFTPVAVLKGEADIDVLSDDIVRALSVTEARLLFATIEQFDKDRQSSDEALRNPLSDNPARGTEKLNAGESADSAAAAAAAAQSDAGNAVARQMLSRANNQQAAAQADQNAASIPQQMLQQQQPQFDANSPFPDQPGPGDADERKPADGAIVKLSDLALQLKVDPLVLANFLDDHTVNIYGAVHGPGLYLSGPETDVASLLQAAGGLGRWADRGAVEVISTVFDDAAGGARTERKTISLTNGGGALRIAPRDQVRVSEVYTEGNAGAVTLQGQVRHSGTYQIVHGEHLSDLLLRAGGLTDTAYPYGTVFLRRAAAAREQDANRREAQQIEDQLLVAMNRRDAAKLSPEGFAALQGYVNQLRTQKALGRVTVTADPAVLAANPAVDPLLEAGDVVFIPSRPFSVSLMGEVLQRSSIPYQPGLSVSDYIKRAGGFSQFADDSLIFVVLPDGSARRAETSWFGFGDPDIPPGSTIYVARDVSGYDLHQMVVDLTSIFSQLATTAAALAVLSKQ
jgi:polysaccharide biosynthesis/export protein